MQLDRRPNMRSDVTVDSEGSASLPIAHRKLVPSGVHSTYNLEGWQMAVICTVAFAAALSIGMTIGLVNAIQTNSTFIKEYCQPIRNTPHIVGSEDLNNWTSCFSPDLWQQPYSFVVLKGVMCGLLIAGFAIGALLAAPTIVDQIGRPWSIFTMNLFCIAGILAVSLGRTITSLYIGMAINGIGLGALSYLVPAYLSEIIPACQRRGFGFFFPLTVVAGMTGGAAFCFMHPNQINWWYLLGIPIITTGLVFLLSLAMPESAVYNDLVLLREHGANVFDSRFTATEVGGTRVVREDPSRARVEAVEERALHSEESQDYEPVPIAVPHPAGAAGVTGVDECERHAYNSVHLKRMMNETSLSNRFALATTMQWIQQWCGFMAFALFSTSIFEMSGIANPVLCTVVFFGSYLLGTATGIGILDIAPRRILTLVGGFMMAAYFAVYGALQYRTWETPNKGIGVACVVMACLFAYTFGATWGPVGWVYPAEVFPSAYRSVGLTLSSANQWAAMILLAFLTPLIFRGINVWGALFLFMGVTAIGSILAIALMPETLDVDPNSGTMAARFGGKGEVNHVYNYELKGKSLNYRANPAEADISNIPAVSKTGPSTSMGPSSTSTSTPYGVRETEALNPALTTATPSGTTRPDLTRQPAMAPSTGRTHVRDVGIAPADISATAP